MKALSTVFWIILLSFILSGCNMDEVEFSKLSKEVTLNPEFVFPVAKGNFTVWDFVSAANTETETNLTKDPNGLVKIVYRQNDLFTYNVRDLIDLPEVQNFSSNETALGEITPDDIILSNQISLKNLGDQSGGPLSQALASNGMTAPFPAISTSNINAPFIPSGLSDYTSITMSKGVLDIHIENRMKFPITVKGMLYDNGLNKKLTEFTFANLEPYGFKNVTSSLAGVVLSNQIEFRVLLFETPGSVTPIEINQDDYFKIKFMMKDLAISEGTLKLPNGRTLEDAQGSFEFNFPEPDLKCFTAEVKKGSLTIKSVNNLQLPGSVLLTLPEVKDKNTGLPVSANISLNGTSTVIPLDNAVINFSSLAAQPYNMIPYTYSITINSTSGYIHYSSADILQLDVNLNNLEFKSITGDFGQKQIQIDPGVFNLNVDMLDKMDGGFKLTDPSLILTIRNSIGIPGTVELDFTASNKNGNTVSLNAPVIELPVPASPQAGVATKDVVFNKQNTNIVDFIALPPTGDISFQGKAGLNAAAPVTAQNPNFVNMDATLGIDMTMDLPLQLQITNLGFKDTTEISGSDLDNIETADLILNAKNGIPLDVEMQLLFVDTISGHQYGSSKMTKILSAAKVNTSGAITPVQASHTFSLDESEMENLRKANGLVFSGSISSPDSGTTAAPLFSDSKIELNVVIKSKFNL